VPHIRIIGDVHGKLRQYSEVIRDADYSIQIGDLGFDYSFLKHNDNNRHVFFGGNHDNYDVYSNCLNSLGDYGNIGLGGLEFFFIRGAYSIDKKYREAYHLQTGKKTWWEEEELNYSKSYEAIEEYETFLPDVMITHDAPTEIAQLVGKDDALRAYGFDPSTFNTNTQKLLQAAFEVHQPKLWIFGHFHRNWIKTIKGTTFICLDELRYLDINKDGWWTFMKGKGRVNLQNNSI